MPDGVAPSAAAAFPTVNSLPAHPRATVPNPHYLGSATQAYAPLRTRPRKQTPFKLRPLATV